ncbi:N-acylglucosamine 2-epimerase [Candidatus Moduliflexus flocculans]|uniref:N-acylglucosamine 2-epimerase n=1 Tax=Candidatus Moduliflexus flocculans TaxID=1499966 RepID=A0A081BPI1_9BACT|nr:N-acylglucosamine 2-epimerase [Candidatus Moduliflexus flocculans]
MNIELTHRQALLATYRDGLLQDTLPFWMKHSVDREHGGFCFALNRDGSRLSADKFLWLHGRFVWLLSTLYQTVEPKAEWLELARHGLDFMRRYGFDTDGRMFFSVTQDGRPLRKRRYLFSEAFAAMALAAYANAANDADAARQAGDLFRLMLRYITTPGLLEPKVNPQTRPLKGLTLPMILIAVAQTLRETTNDPLCDEWIQRSIDEIERDFMKPEFDAVLETVGTNGEFYDNFDGRMVCPGHSIEAAWFILHEAKYRGNDPRLIRLGCTILDWSWRLGWDDQFGGLLYYRDAKGLPSAEYWHDMKFWWPHNEAIIATLLAYVMTGDAKYREWHQLAHDWAYAHFPDPEFGEWFGYLHRDGTVSTQLKGNTWKGPFHLPRMQWYCWQLLEK